MQDVVMFGEAECNSSYVIQELTDSEMNTLCGGNAPPKLTPEQVTNTQALVVAGTIGSALGNNPLGAPALGLNAGNNYVYGILSNNDPLLKLADSLNKMFKK